MNTGGYNYTGSDYRTCRCGQSYEREHWKSGRSLRYVFRVSGRQVRRCPDCGRKLR